MGSEHHGTALTTLILAEVRTLYAYSNDLAKRAEELSRRDDIEAIGNVLLYFLHGELPWQGIYAPSVKDKLQRLGIMKSGKAMNELLDRSPALFSDYYRHCRSLAFEAEPDYVYLRTLFRKGLEVCEEYGEAPYDWLKGGGTLIPEEYEFDERYISKDIMALTQYVM